MFSVIGDSQWQGFIHKQSLMAASSFLVNVAVGMCVCVARLARVRHLAATSARRHTGRQLAALL